MNVYPGPDFIDTHVHLDILPLAEDQPGAISRAEKAGVRQIITIGIDLASSKKSLELAQQFPHVYAAVGIHPHDAKGASDEVYKELLELAGIPNVVAWGEIGLDFVKEYSPRDIQRKVFRQQIQMAGQVDLPIIIHNRDAHVETVKILREEATGALRGVMHCFSGNTKVAKQVLDLGFFISVTGIITFPKAEVVKEVVRYVPLERLLIETDSPFLSPVPYRGKPNEPARVIHVAEEIARIKEMPLEEIARCTSANARDLFRLPVP
ncbi:MAG: TatD family hydrolase [Deltaproteobacteria bacterium]|nr:TatD family hydrolase [Deltaproteobacteria bacterium]MBW1718777.1 TatD family hydrolase [Deltaproteobacteria bacterium]MBW1932516.1 TatD family hydrolase [Deltaproteobacteria bacterium]MBW1937882.1 TatD family hydrolase [Deltaproteobacteria bacterium]MBW1963883.1 TatD family hydrolase [Deltaproteobacteria bacterium]